MDSLRAAGPQQKVQNAELSFPLFVLRAVPSVETAQFVEDVLIRFRAVSCVNGSTLALQRGLGHARRRWPKDSPQDFSSKKQSINRRPKASRHNHSV